MAEVAVGIRPGPVAAGAGSVWVGNLDDRTLTKVDSRQRMATATLSLESRTPTGIAVGEGAVWVAHGRLGQLSRVDPQFNQLAETIDVAGPSVQQGAVAVGAGSVWAGYGESTLARVDPAPVHVSAAAAHLIRRCTTVRCSNGNTAFSGVEDTSLPTNK